MGTKIESILPPQTRNTYQPQWQTSSQSTGLGKKYQSNGPKKEAGTAILISNKIDFNLKSIKKDKEGHSILVTGKIHQE